jgi:hypothetical protein
MSERAKSIVTLIAGLMMALGGTVSVARELSDLWTTTGGIGGVLIAVGGVVLTWASKGPDALADRYQPRPPSDPKP